MSVTLGSKVDLTVQEIAALLDTFSGADLARAKRIAALYCQGLDGWMPDDLLQEAFTKFLAGDRRWPLGEHPLVVLKTAMHSIASNARKRNRISPIDGSVVLDPSAELDGGMAAVVGSRTTITPEDEVSGRQQLATVYEAIAGDEDLELLAMAWADGLRGNEAGRELGWDKQKYDAARNRLNRRLKALDPERRAK